MIKRGNQIDEWLNQFLPQTKPILTIDSNQHFSSFALSHDEKWLAASDSTFVNIFAYGPNRELKLSKSFQTGGNVNVHPMSLAFGKDGLTLLTSSQGGEANLWKPDKQALPVATFVHGGRTLCLAAFSADEKEVVTIDLTGLVKFWTNTFGVHRDPIRTFQIDRENRIIRTMVLSPDRTILAIISTDEVARLYYLSEKGLRAPFATLPTGHNSQIAISPDNKMIAVAPSSGNAFLRPLLDKSRLDLASAQIIEFASRQKIVERSHLPDHLRAELQKNEVADEYLFGPRPPEEPIQKKKK